MTIDIKQYIPKDFDQATQKVEGLGDLVNSYVVAPLAGFGIAGFKFSAFRQYKAELKANATDYYTEKNIAIQDNLTIDPEIFSLSGVVSELNYEYKEASNLKKMAEKLTTIAGFLPTITSTMRSLQDTINARNAGAKAFVDSSLATAQDLWATYQKLNPPKTLQAKAYNYFLALRNARVLISFDTPYGFKQKFAIINLIMTQPEATEGKSEVEIILKEIKFARTKTTTFDPNKYQSRAKVQNEPTENKGSTQGQQDTQTFEQRSNRLIP